MKKLIVIAVILVILGGIVFVGALAAANFDINRFASGTTYEKKNKTYTYAGQSITVDDANGYIRIVKSTDADIHIEYYESEHDVYTISDAGDISFVKDNLRKWYDYLINYNFREIGMTIAIPENYNANLDIHTSNGKLSADGVTAGRMDLSTSNGAFELNNLTCSNMVVRTSNGKIEASALRATDKIDFKTSNGAVKVNDLVTKEFFADSSNGAINAQNVEAQKISLKTSNNAIDVGDLKASEAIYLKSSNGGIRGGIIGSMVDFDITSHTSNGSNNLPANASLGPIRLEVDTSNGDININFVQE